MQPTTAIVLDATPASVTAARRLVVEAAADLGWPGETEDAALAVTEAVTNAVLHAYGEGGGPVGLEIRVLAGMLEVVVWDTGAGFLPGDPRGPRTGLGMGLPLMRRLSTRCEVRSLPGRGTRVTLTFAAHPAA